ncbi:20378_t:CDS:1, partial [Rhizophagus irregularis]
DTKGCYSRLDNINQTVLNVIELSKALKEKSVDNVDEKENERAMDSLFIKELLNIVFSNFVLKITGVFN